MALTPGTRLGLYEIVAPLGAGGMGEVYRATDTKLGRAVAVKILPDALAADADRISRFEREARVLASLNHPHIAALYGMEQADGRHFLVMELVEGDTLADRLQRGPMPLEDVLKVALQIAEALEAAHEKGIVHRDLKPANVKITPDDTVKVLDFGLAKAMDDRSASLSGERPGFTHSPTLSLMATEAGMILGTAAYMSPEQAKGFPADQRSDVFSFGVVLYEMLTGRQPFQGETAPEILASVLVREADLGLLPPNLNPRLIDLVKRCLDKTPKRRWQAVGDLRAELEAIATAPRGMPALGHGVAPTLWTRAVPVAVAAIVFTIIGGWAVWNLKPSAALPTITRFSFTLAEGQQFTNDGRQLVAISPDGTQMVYVANLRLYLRSMLDLEARAIPGTEILQGVLNPVFSPDGRSVAFWSVADQTIKRIAITGGAAVTICPAARPNGMTWDTNGIIFGQGGAGIMRVMASGGKPEIVVKVKEGEIADRPQILPDDRTVLFTLATGSGADRWDKAQVVAQSLGSAERKILIEGGSDGRYLPTGHIVYALGGTLFAVPFDLRRLEITGGPVPIVEGIKRATTPEVNTGVAHFSVSSTGSLIYIPGPVSTTAMLRDLVRLDRKGGTEPLKIPQGPYESPRISPDGKRLALGTDDGKEATVWIYDLAGTTSMRRLTFGGRNRFPVWSADGERVAFQSDRERDLAVFWQRADGSGTAERLTRPEQGTAHFPESWDPKGERFLFSVNKGSNLPVSLWTFSLQEKKAEPFGGVQNPNFNPTLIKATFSPDGRWVAYGEGGPGAVYVQPFPATGAKYQISNSGDSPLWSPDGKAIFYSWYVGAGVQLAVIRITTQPTFTFSTPVPAPSGRLQLLGGLNITRRFDMAPDGSIIGVADSGQTPSGAPTTPQINVVLNWFDELKRLVPAGAP